MTKYKIVKYRNTYNWYVLRRVCFFFWKEISWYRTFNECYNFVERQSDYKNEPILLQVNKTNR